MRKHTCGDLIARFGFNLKLVASAVAILISVTARGESGVSEKEILVGTLTNLTRKKAGIGEEFNAGITAYINKINRSGGIHGRKIKRLLYNDSYEPEHTLIETKRLVDQDKVFALIGYASTPGVKKILPFIENKKVPVIAPYSGANILREGKEKNIFNIKAGYTDQVEALTKLGVYSLGFKEVCVFDQDDLIGNEARAAADRTLQKYNLKLLAHAEYQRNSLDVQPSLKKLKAAGWRAIVMASQDRQTAAFIISANAMGFHPVYLCFNLIGTELFLNSVGGLQEKIFVSVVTPLPSETAYPIVREFRRDLKKLNPSAEYTTTTLEGFLAGAVFEEVLKRAGKNLTRSTVTSAFESLKDANIGGVNFTFNKANRQATNHVLITKAEGDELVLLP